MQKLKENNPNTVTTATLNQKKRGKSLPEARDATHLEPPVHLMLGVGEWQRAVTVFKQ
jgi:hypothetical protein